jgi:hypothetical protein
VIWRVDGSTILAVRLAVMVTWLFHCSLLARSIVYYIVSRHRLAVAPLHAAAHLVCHVSLSALLVQLSAMLGCAEKVSSHVGREWPDQVQTS